MSLQNFTAYQLAQKLYLECSTIKAKPFIEDQLKRASLSIVLNLAEGSAKTSTKDRKRFYEIALGSTREVQALVELIGTTLSANQTGACIFKLTRSLQ